MALRSLTRFQVEDSESRAEVVKELNILLRKQSSPAVINGRFAEAREADAIALILQLEGTNFSTAERLTDSLIDEVLAAFRSHNAAAADGLQRGKHLVVAV